MIVARDNKGHKFRSIKDMARFYEIRYETLLFRINHCRNFDDVFNPVIEEKGISKECVDHLGNRYKSISQMCRTYNIHYDTFFRRMRKHGDLKRALEEPVAKKDHGYKVLFNGKLINERKRS